MRVRLGQEPPLSSVHDYLPTSGRLHNAPLIRSLLVYDLYFGFVKSWCCKLAAGQADSAIGEYVELRGEGEA